MIALKNTYICHFIFLSQKTQTLIIMKKNLFTVGFLALTFSLGAQQVLCHVDENGIFFVGKNALVYNGGGLQMKGNALYENHGNVMVVGNGTGSVFKTINASNADKTEATGGGNFINKINEPLAFTLPNSPNQSDTPTYTYGQLYITDISQDNITGIVDQEFLAVKHGAYQQIGMPFYGKSASTLNSELGKTFSTTRRSGNEILIWNNRNVVFDNLPNLNFKFGQNAPAFSYYSIGGNGLDLTITRILKGRPVSDQVVLDNKITLKDAGLGIDFGIDGSKINGYGGRYNTYVQDGFAVAMGGTVWQGDFGKNIYQLANPYLTNLDLSQIATNEINGDGNDLSNIYGVRLEVSGVQYNPNAGGGSTSYKAITYVRNDITGVTYVTGDVQFQVVRPLGTFVVKLRNNNQQTLDFSTLRRFKYTPRLNATEYDVTAKREVNKTSTLKQLGVIGLDVNGNEVERTYYIVSDNTVSGASKNVKAQIGAIGNQLFGTYEEDALNGGYDNNNTSYWLYLNETNENDFKGKNIKLVNYNANIVSFKFELRENAVLVEDATHLLSQGEGFYYRKENETTVHPILQNGTANSVAGVYPDGVEYNLYYGKPSGTLDTDLAVKKSSTIVVFNPENDNYFVKFDPTWKNSTVQVFDMSGKLVHSAEKVSASGRYELPLLKTTAGYIVHITSDKGEKVVTKILR